MHLKVILNRHMDIGGNMNKRRVCVKCGKYRVCRVNTAKSINNHQKLCLACNRQICRDWYADPDNAARKCEYQKQYRLGYRARSGMTWLQWIKNNYDNWSATEKLLALYASRVIRGG